jgi:uncharacterized RDD family membrane protein YckC
MTYGMSMIEDDLLTRGVLTRRVLAWCVDVFLLAIIVAACWTTGLVFGLMTLGLGMPLLGLLPLVPLAYHCLFLASSLSATPGQALFGLRVRRNDDMGQPSFAQAVVSTLIFYMTLATSGLLLLVALFTIRKRTLHDLLSGLVVVRERALTPPAGFWNIPGGRSPT